MFFSLLIILFFVLSLSTQDSYASPISSQTTQKLINNKLIGATSTIISAVPARLKIPKIKVDAALESVGLTSKGAVGVPKIPANAAWFNLGPRPGDNGNAVITGHYGRWINGQGSIFDNLNKLKKGDKIYVEDKKGAIATFVVREIRIYSPKADASDVFISNDGNAHLNLITCEGTWNRFSKSYPKRLVVFADKE